MTLTQIPSIAIVIEGGLVQTTLVEGWPSQVPLPQIVIVDYDDDWATEDELTTFTIGNEVVDALCHLEIPQAYESFKTPALSPCAVLTALGVSINTTYPTSETPAASTNPFVRGYHTLQATQETVGNIRFENGFFSQCWEISLSHISEESERFLHVLIETGTPGDCFFTVFKVPGCPAIGIKLFSTPWTDQNLSPNGITASDLRQIHRSQRLPEDLIELLHLAAQADVRLLILDADAPQLEGLPVISP